jgi:hypothetical protein
MFIGGDKPDVREASISGRREATRDELIFAFTLPRSTTRHKLGIQRYKGKASRQIETLFERPA